eukprot:TRINITY_DN111175_c0_g1_i1.p1 TRINITY_DN111175_c0_g1~~TRINITY_DN111175_c0_g1_i1.p1  ORF type:complete len:452 (-),score=56.55 TRINITY_DN111175_c0_g1_i1:96-1406(-)
MTASFRQRKNEAAVCQIVHQTAPSDRNRWDPRWECCHKSWHQVCPSHSFQHILWDDDGLRDLVKEAFPEHLEIYDGYEEHIQRVDFARAAMLYLHGGLYVDMDVEVFESPFPYFPPGKVSVVGSPYTNNERHQNSMMASPPRHSFWRELANEAVRRRRRPGEFRTTWQLTGPQLLDAVIDLRPEDVHALPPDQFNPAVQSQQFSSPTVITRHLCTSVWTHSMDISSMALYQAVRSRDRKAAEEAVVAGADLDARDYAGLAPIHHAVLKMDAGMVFLLASLKAEVNSKDKNDTTALHYAAQLQASEAVKALLDCKASCDGRLAEGVAAGQTALDLAKDAQRMRPSKCGNEVIRLLTLANNSVSDCDRLRTNSPWWASSNVHGSADRQKRLSLTRVDIPTAKSSLVQQSISFSCLIFCPSAVRWPKARRVQKHLIEVN